MAPLKKMSFEKFQRPVYASAMILGIAYQAGRLPFELDDLNKAFQAAVPKSEIDSNWKAFNMGRDWFLNHDETSSEQLNESGYWEESVKLAAYPWQSGLRMANLWNSYVKIFTEKLPEINPEHIKQYIHDLIVFDQGKYMGLFLEHALELKKLYSGESLQVAVRVMAKTFWIKDEVFVSHQMISPLKTHLDEKKYKDLGTGFKVIHINRPGFIIMGRKIEFDFSPSRWMLHMMKHMRVLRLILADWHKNEKDISLTIRNELLSTTLPAKRILELDNIKGYREVRYKLAEKYLGKKYV